MVVWHIRPSKRINRAHLNALFLFDGSHQVGVIQVELALRTTINIVITQLPEVGATICYRLTLFLPVYNISNAIAAHASASAKAW